jgi:hypothetical protein
MGRVTVTSVPVDGTHAPVTDDRFFKALTILGFCEKGVRVSVANLGSPYDGHGRMGYQRHERDRT